MLRIILLSVFIFGSLAGSAWAGTDVWTPSQINKGGTTSITVTTDTTTPILETRMCGTGILWTDDTAVTFDIQICRGSDASTCTTSNATSPIDASSNVAAEFDVVGGNLRISVVSNSPATFTFDCNP